MNTDKSIFINPNFFHYLVQYKGDVMKDLDKIPSAHFTLLTNKVGVLSLPLDASTDNILTLLPSIEIVKYPSYYSLQSTSPVEASEITKLHELSPLSLTGKGVVVGIVDTGIDYLLEEFITKEGKTRINYIWDQSLPGDNNIIDELDTPFGVLYNSTQINSAIEAHKNNKNPYEVVPSRDTLGHGTKMSALIGAGETKSNFISAAPECEFFVVKLQEDLYIEKQLDVVGPIYNIINVYASLKVLKDYSIKYNKPLVIYLPLGTNSGNHKGAGFLEAYIDEISINKGLVIVTGSGNEANVHGHNSGVLINGYSDIQLYVAPEDKNIWVEIWITKPNIMSLSVISPSGENTGLIPAFLNAIESNIFTFEKTTVTIRYFYPEVVSGDELIYVYFKDLQPGTWKLRLSADYILNGTYNAWLPQKALIKGDTQFVSPDAYGTITNPGSSLYIITTANYNQNNDNLVNSSGMSFLDNFYDIDLASGGVNVLTLGPGGSSEVVNGTSVSAAVVAGACALLLQWGIVDGHDPSMYSQKIKTYLIRGTTKRSGDIYPNPEWGYGILNMLGVFKSMI